VFAPQDIGAIPANKEATAADAANATIAFDYAIPSQNVAVGQTPPVFWARTKHKDVFHTTGNPLQPTDTIDTIVLVDGLGRVRQTKKDTTVGGSTTTRILSGRTTFDQVGRVFQEGFPSLDPDPGQTVFSRFVGTTFAKTYAHDVLGRVRAIQTPDNKGTDIAPDGAKAVTTKISFDPKTLDGRTQLAKTIEDPFHKLRTLYMSPRGEILAVSEQNRLGTSTTLTTLTTRYSYDPLSQLIQVQDPSANLTTATYDSIGNMVMLKSPDSAQTEWRYDLSGRLAAKETANLRFKTLLVKYTYDFNRLKTIVYPSATAFPGATGLVTYTYGRNDQTGASLGNIAGRLAKVQDESGVETRQYDKLGNVSHMEKTPMTLSLSIPGVTYKMDYVYDQLGRVQSMKYPDGETITYGYDAGGLPNFVKGTRQNGSQMTYVSNVNYNDLEQRTGITLGNGWSSQYFYYTDTKRLQSIVTTKGTAKIQDTLIFYDLVGNISSIGNALPVLPPVPPNTVIAPGPTSQSFTYDDLYQLTGSSGNYTGCACGCGNTRNYALTFEYDGLGNITRKNQTDTIIKPTGAAPQAATTYNNGYTYGALQLSGQKAGPHAPTGVGPAETISYDRDGNQTQYSGSFGPSRSLTWTEDDRLRSETDSGFTNSFLYDAGGTRTHKRRTTLETWYVNANYVVKNSLTESKHIMLGNDRVVTAVATITNRADPTTAGTNTLFYYHPDHLQSSSYVTGGDASILQHDEYFPSGEVWFQEQKNNDARNTQPYLFSAKELDETGLYYFGARYYNPKVSVWIGPDPLAASAMKGGTAGDGVYSPRNLGLYTYALNNPIALRDLDGNDWFPVNWNPLGEIEAIKNDVVNALSTVAHNIGTAATSWSHEVNTNIGYGIEQGYKPGGTAEENAERGIGVALYQADVELMTGETFYLPKLPYRTTMKVSSAESVVPPVVPPPTAPRGSANPVTAAAAARGSTLHSDTPGNLPDQLRSRYPDTQFDFTKPGKAGQDVRVTGGTHPSEYPGSPWPPGVNYADFKPGTPSGARTFNRDQKVKWSDPTYMLSYDSSSGVLK
jgi:RHS repeat-associated protein